MENYMYHVSYLHPVHAEDCRVHILPFFLSNTIEYCIL